jgi:hypothetical protein
VKLASIYFVSSAILALSLSSGASAITMAVRVGTIGQSGTGPQVRVGHTVQASTNYNRLWAGGSYTVSCAHPSMQPAGGSRSLFDGPLIGPASLVVTIPRNQPATVTMAGFESLAPGSFVSCTYRWSAFAREGTYTIGAGGIGSTVGGGEHNEEGTRVFNMTSPSRVNNAPSDPVCLPPDHKGD